MSGLEIKLADEDERHVGGMSDPPPKKPKPPKTASPPRVKPALHVVPLASLERDPAINCRAGGVSERVAAEYAENVEKLPPVVAFKDADGKLWLADGWHRVRAHEIVGNAEIAVDVREGGRREALLFAASANAAHGARRTNADKRRAVLALLADPEWAGKADEWIARQCAVSDRFVAKLRPATPNGSESKREGRDGKVRRVPRRKANAGERAERDATREIGAALAKLTRRHAAKRLAALYTQARVWLADLEQKHGAGAAQ